MLIFVWVGGYRNRNLFSQTVDVSTNQKLSGRGGSCKTPVTFTLESVLLFRHTKSIYIRGQQINQWLYPLVNYKVGPTSYSWVYNFYN